MVLAQFTCLQASCHGRHVTDNWHSVLSVNLWEDQSWAKSFAFKILKKYLCEKITSPRNSKLLWNFEISWHYEIIWDNEYICNFWAHIYVILGWDPSSVRIYSTLSVHSVMRSEWELAIPILANHRSAHSMMRNQSDRFPPRRENDPIGWESSVLFSK